MRVNRTSSFIIALVSFIFGLLFLLLFLVIKKPELVRFCCVLFSIALLVQAFYYQMIVDIEIKEDVAVFSKLFGAQYLKLSELIILNATIPSRGSIFLVDTNFKGFRVYYTSKNFNALKELIKCCKSTMISADEIEGLVKNSWKSLK